MRSITVVQTILLIWGWAEGQNKSPSCTLLTVDFDSLASPVQGLDNNIREETEDYGKIVSFSQTATVNGLRVAQSQRQMAFKHAFEFCSNRNSRMVEPTPGNILAIKGAFQGQIWVDAYTPERTQGLYYRSNVPLTTNLGNSAATPPRTLGTGQCLTYDTTTYEFERDNCSAEHEVLCQEVPAHERGLYDKIILHDIYDDIKLTAVEQFLTSGQNELKRNLLALYPQSNALCTSATKVESLAAYLGFDQPLRRLGEMSISTKLHYTLTLQNLIQNDFRRLGAIQHNTSILVEQLYAKDPSLIYQGYDGNGRMCVCPMNLARLTTTTTVKPTTTTTTEPPGVDLTTWGTFDLSELCFVILGVITTIMSTAVAVIQILGTYRNNNARVAHLVEDPRQERPSAPIAPPRYHLTASCSRNSRPRAHTRDRSNSRDRGRSPSVRLIDGTTATVTFQPQRRSSFSSDEGDPPPYLIPVALCSH